MLDQATIEIADHWWARGFDSRPSDLRPTSTHVQEHAGSQLGKTGIWILAVGPSPLVSLPANAMDRLAERASTWTRSTISEVTTLARELRVLERDGIRVGKIVGPAFIGYGTYQSLTKLSSSRVRSVTASDSSSVDSLRSKCNDEEWDHGGSDLNAVPCFGYFDEHGNLLTLAGYETWGAAIAHISIVSAKDSRGQGYASAAVSHAAQHALNVGLLPQYRTLMTNKSSMTIAKKLGFEPYGFSVYVRLHPDSAY